MRLRQLELIRYGHFTGESIDLPFPGAAREIPYRDPDPACLSKPSDFHIVFGPNEAGKSTALSAIEDFLFGFPRVSPYNFLHDYKDMRVGAVVEQGRATVEAVRRKGSRNTLLDADGSPDSGAESTLSAFLANANRRFFTRMFSLDHVRLETGGQEILQAKDDVGQMLFSAGTGIVGLQKQLERLDQVADQLWARRRANHRKYYQAKDRYDAAKSKLREHTVTAHKWQELKRDFDNAQREYAETGEKIEKNTAERCRLNRICTVLPNVSKKKELDRQLARLVSVVSLPNDAKSTFEEAAGKDGELAARIDTLKRQLGSAKASLGDLAFDDKLLQRSKDIDQIEERRIQIRAEKADLPKRQAELAAAENRLRTDARDLGWPESDAYELASRIPPPGKVKVAQDLLKRRGERALAVKNASDQLADSREAVADKTKRLEKIGGLADFSRLSAIVSTVQKQGDLLGSLNNAGEKFEQAQELADRRLEALQPSVPNETMLTAAPVPGRPLVKDFGDREQNLRGRLHRAREDIATARRERDAAAAALDRMVRDEQVVTSEELQSARRQRDELWGRVKNRRMADEPVAEDRAAGHGEAPVDLIDDFERAIDGADRLADRRFDCAEAAGRAMEVKRTIGEQQTLLDKALDEEARLIAQGNELSAEWASMWSGLPFDPLPAGTMLDWLSARKEVLTAIEERSRVEVAVASRRRAVSTARQQLIQELTTIGFDAAALTDKPLNVVLEHASGELTRRQIQADRKTTLERELSSANRTVIHRERQLANARRAMDVWNKVWADALTDLGLPPNTAPVAAEPQFDAIDRMRATAQGIASLRHDRIDKIIRNVAVFEQDANDLIRSLASDLTDLSAEDALVELSRRLTEAKEFKKLRGNKVKDIKNLASSISRRENQRREIAASIAHLKRLAGVETRDELQIAIERSDRRRSVKQDLQEIVEQLRRDGDGKSPDELEDECAGASIDQLMGRANSLEKELEDLLEQKEKSALERNDARAAYEAIGGDDSAAQAASEKQDAVAEMRLVAERYIRVRTTALLLRWAIDRFKREKQAPLLQRTGELFAIVTGGAFSRLQVEYDDKDNALLAGVRPYGEIVPVSGMSTGTADQLYLSLRIAAVEDHLAGSSEGSEAGVGALPFVADDLFVNFDDDRAASGLRLLEELGRKTQVLFFTHHQHLVDIARKTLGEPISVTTLAKPDKRSA